MVGVGYTLTVYCTVNICSKEKEYNDKKNKTI
jgi:hypothetical protein